MNVNGKNPVGAEYEVVVLVAAGCSVWPAPKNSQCSKTSYMTFNDGVTSRSLI